MAKIDHLSKKLAKSDGKFDMSFKQVANDLENRLQRMGIPRPHHGPRISDPAHTRPLDDLGLSSHTQYGVKRYRAHKLPQSI